MTPRQQLDAIINALSVGGRRPSRAEAVNALLKVLRAAVGGSVAGMSPKAILNTLKNSSRGSLGSAPGGNFGGTAGSSPYKPPIPGEPPQVPPGTTAASAPPPPFGRRPKYQPEGYPEERGNFSEEFLSPQSSNVYSFQYYRRPRDRTGILYVTFKAQGLNTGAMSHGAPRFKGGRRQLRGERGKTVTGMKRNAPGPTYAYFAVPPAVFTRMQSAASKGTFVWDELRIRGTVYGHRYNYSLVVGQLTESATGAPGQYIPRKATKRGFVTRSISDIGTGRRGFISSTLPPTTLPSGGQGFSTRR
jgi:hypothetical protein